MKNPNPDHISVCIPAYKELDLLDTLDSLANCETEGLTIRVYILINGSSADGRVTFDTNMLMYGQMEHWVDTYSGNIEFLYDCDLDLPIKDAGVGLARKILGDQARDDFEEMGVDGVISYLDADCVVEKNYFLEIHSFFASSLKKAAAIHYEHPIENPKEDNSIIEYELHLRYYILMQDYIGLPFAIHTVGSSMAVLSSAYRSKGGMNKRKAGEDFYFLQKFIKDGVCGKITSTTVYPSARCSDRVPFGTGRAMLAYNDDSFEWPSYNPKSFLYLQRLTDQIKELYHDTWDMDVLDVRFQAFLHAKAFHKKLDEIRSNVSSYEAFQKRFFQYFDAFRLMKYLHYMRDNGVEDIPISDAVCWYFERVLQIAQPKSMYDALLVLRDHEK